MTDVHTRRVLVVAETSLIGIALGALTGVVWWLIAPTEEWTIVEGGELVPADVDFDAWFGADAWFLVLGAIAGAFLALLSWQRGRAQPVALVVGVVIGAGLLAAMAWTLGGVLGPPDPESVAATADPGTTVSGALGVRALGVLFTPALAALTLMVLLLASVRVVDRDVDPSSLADGARVPEQSW